MRISICFKCGAEKANPLDGCPGCGESPVSDHHRVVSLVLSSRRSTPAQLETYAGDIRRYGYPIIEATVLEKAKEEWELSNERAGAAVTQLRQGLDAKGSRPEAIPIKPGPDTWPETKIRDDAANTALELSAFRLLGATTRDPARRIVELAEEKSLTLDSPLCLKARADLLAPRTRLGLEMSWMPGVAPQRANVLLASLRTRTEDIKSGGALPPLAKANLISAAFELLDPAMEQEAWVDWIVSFAETLEEIDLESVLRDINEDRAVAGIPEVRQLDMVEEEMLGRRQHYKTVIKAALNTLPSEKLVEVLANLVGLMTDDGEMHAPLLVDEVVDIYQAEADGHLQEGAERIKRLVEEAKSAAPKGAAAVKPYVERLDAVLRAWNKLAKPIQLSMKARGQDHIPSRNLAYLVRSLGIELFNKYDLVDLVKDFTGRLGNIFADLPEMKQQLQDDSKAIQKVMKGQEEEKRRSEEWAREITYEAEYGLLIFKKKLRISPEGLQLNDKIYPLEAVTRVRWGGIRSSGTSTYTIAFGDRLSETEFELQQESIYQNFVNRLWPAVCNRLMFDMLQALKAGKKLTFGEATVDDHGALLTKHKYFGSENVHVKWADTRIWSHNGSFYIGAKSDKKCSASMSYIDVANAHICEAVISEAFKKRAIPLSNLLRRE